MIEKKGGAFARSVNADAALTASRYLALYERARAEDGSLILPPGSP